MSPVLVTRVPAANERRGNGITLFQSLGAAPLAPQERNLAWNWSDDLSRRGLCGVMKNREL